MEYNKKDELLNKIIGLKYVRQGVPENWYNKGVDDSFRYIKNLFDKEFVSEVPQIVAEWYEKNKKDLEYHIWSYIFDWNEQEESKFKTWMNYTTNKPIETLINMQIFGYEIKKEPKYTVRMKTLGKHSYLTYYKTSDKWNFNEETQASTVWSHHTREELEEAGFDWVFSCEGMEVREVM